MRVHTRCMAVRLALRCRMELPRYQLSRVGTIGRACPIGSCTDSTLEGTHTSEYERRLYADRGHTCI